MNTQAFDLKSEVLTDKEIAQQVAEFLLKIKAIKLQPNEPFTWASGWKSPIYCDNRMALTRPTIREFVWQSMTRRAVKFYSPFDVVASVATAGIPWGTLMAESLKLPAPYIRSAPKDHGKENMIEGEINDSQSAVVVEDLISTGGSSLKAVAALRERGVNVKGLISIFTYGFDVAEEQFDKARCPHYSLCDYNTLIEVAIQGGFVSNSDLETLQAWRKNPASWGK